MKKIIACIIVVLLTMTISVRSQSTNKLSIAPGYKLSWELSLGYNFDIKIIELNPDFRFDWSMGQKSSGEVTVKHDALLGAKKLINNFSNGDTITYLKATTTLVSGSVYDSLKAGMSVNILSNDTLQELTFIRIDKLNVLIDGIGTSLVALYAETDLKHKYWIWDNAETPFILKMDLGWTIELKSISTKK